MVRRKTRIAAGVIAAVIGTFMLFTIVNNQDEQTTGQVVDLGSVVVIKTAIPRQTPVELIGESVEVV
ncbi:MAG: hypothetical protein ACYC0U_01205, partial [Ilumatobacteraceae bacterium]